MAKFDPYRPNKSWVIPKLRNEVDDQIKAYRKSKHFDRGARCVGTGNKAHVGHKYAFHYIAQDWLRDEGLREDQLRFKYSPGPYGYGWELLIDRALAKRWQEYHRAQAQLIMLDADLNMSMGTRDCSGVEEAVSERAVMEYEIQNKCML